MRTLIPVIGILFLAFLPAMADEEIYETDPEWAVEIHEGAHGAFCRKLERVRYSENQRSPVNCLEAAIALLERLKSGKASERQGTCLDGTVNLESGASIMSELIAILKLCDMGPANIGTSAKELRDRLRDDFRRRFALAEKEIGAGKTSESDALSSILSEAKEWDFVPEEITPEVSKK